MRDESALTRVFDAERRAFERLFEANEVVHKAALLAQKAEILHEVDAQRLARMEETTDKLREDLFKAWGSTMAFVLLAIGYLVGVHFGWWKLHP